MNCCNQWRFSYWSRSSSWLIRLPVCWFFFLFAAGPVIMTIRIRWLKRALILSLAINFIRDISSRVHEQFVWMQPQRRYLHLIVQGYKHKPFTRREPRVQRATKYAFKITYSIVLCRCGPCKVIAPKFQELSKEYLDVVFLKLDCSQENKVGSICHGWICFPEVRRCAMSYV